MFNRKIREEIEKLRWKVQALTEDNKDLKHDLEMALKVLRQQMVKIQKGEAVSERALLEGLAFDAISGKDLDALKQRNPDIVLLDVRSVPEFSSGYIPGALHIPVDQLMNRVHELGKVKNVPVVAYCASGARSQVACEILVDHGFSRLYNLEAGIGGFTGSLERPKTSGVKTEIPQRRDDMTPEEKSMADVAEKILREEINPAVASHGGIITLLDVRNKDVFIHMGGGCQGCSSSMATLKDGVDQALRKVLPDLGSVFDTTDHAKGENPYFA